MNNENKEEAITPSTSTSTLAVPNYCKDILAQIGPIDKLLGSVSYSDIDGIEGKTQQLRTSARVFKKMKYDLSHAPPVQEKKEEVKTEDVKHESRKPANPLWTSEEKKMFFEALNEFGKDFESIHTQFSTRMKKKNISEDVIKTKHQIRHFYYKTFHMLLGYLKFPDRIPKNAQELYALINYGELRRKVGSVNKKNWPKLNELINHGSITLRVKGKLYKIKTPMCRALRRLNQLDEKYDDLKLPTKVLVELKPKNMASFLKVQSMAQNPRIKMALSLQKRLSSLITCINIRWKTTDTIIYDKALVPTNVHAKDCVPSQKVIEENLSLLTSSLRLTPPSEAHIDLPSIDISEYFTGQSICLNAFEARKGVKSTEEIAKKDETATEITYTNKTEVSPNKPSDEDTTSSKEEKSSASVHQVVDEAVSTILFLQTPETQSKSDKIPETVPTDIKDVKIEQNREQVELIRRGWTLETCGCLTIGEMYLMFGADSKLLLEYCWDDLLESPVKAEDFGMDCSVSNILKKMVSLAKLQCSKPNPKCNCGHVCGAATTKNNAQFKKPLPAKTTKKSVGTQESTGDNSESSLHTKTQASNQNSQYSNFPMVHLINQIDTMQRLNPKFGSRRKHLVVERNLVPNETEKNHQIVTMNIISTQETKPTENASNKLNTTKNSTENKTAQDDSGVTPKNNNNNVEKKTQEVEAEKSFSGLLCDQSSNTQLSTGLSNILNENENQWLNPDVAEYSLSSLLGHLDSSKPDPSCESLPISVDIANEESLPQVGTQLINTLLFDTSMDFSDNFADLAAQVVDNKK